jgi:3',5'-cyclic AMP phosphodiesterase CpdA
VPTLLHLSDVHFGPKHQSDAAEAVRELARRERPDLVVLSGDLTQRAKPAQFRAARAFVESLPAPVAVVPGNHDVPLWRFWERLLAPFGAWRRNFAPQLVHDRIAGGVAALGVNTAHAWTTKHGRLRAVDLADLATRLAALPAGVARAVVAHHPVAAGAELGGEPTTRRGAALLEVARRSGVELVLCGHLHRSFVQRPGGPLVVHCGTTTSSRGRDGERGRNSLCWIEITPRSIAVERRVREAGGREFVAVERHQVERREAPPAAAPG